MDSGTEPKSLQECLALKTTLLCQGQFPLMVKVSPTISQAPSRTLMPKGETNIESSDLQNIQVLLHRLQILNGIWILVGAIDLIGTGLIQSVYKEHQPNVIF